MVRMQQKTQRIGAMFAVVLQYVQPASGDLFGGVPRNLQVFSALDFQAKVPSDLEVVLDNEFLEPERRDNQPAELQLVLDSKFLWPVALFRRLRAVCDGGMVKLHPYEHTTIFNIPNCRANCLHYSINVR